MHLIDLLPFLGLTIALGLLGAGLSLFLRWKLKFSLREEIQGILGVSVSFVAMLFSFFLGFTIVDLWQAYDHAERVVSEEANEIRTMYRLAKGVEGGGPLRDDLIEYARDVVTTEFPEMKKGKAARVSQDDTATNQKKDLIWDKVLTMANSDQGQIHQQLLNSVIRFNTLRRERLSLVGPAIHPLLNASIVVLAGMTLLGFFLLGSRVLMLQFLVDLTVISSVGLSLYLLVELDDPFSGRGFFVTSDPFAELVVRAEKDRAR